jgi:hypothetical protein
MIYTNMQDFKFSQKISALKSSWAISHVPVELKTKVSELSPSSVIRLNDVDPLK